MVEQQSDMLLKKVQFLPSLPAIGIFIMKMNKRDEGLQLKSYLSKISTQYCPSCGEKEEPFKIRSRLYGTDGKPSYIIEFRCPNYRWYHFGGHSSYGKVKPE